jgi:hypothetical protein
MSLDLTCDASGNDCLPTVIADEYWIKVNDTPGEVKRSVLLRSVPLSKPCIVVEGKGEGQKDRSPVSW